MNPGRYRVGVSILYKHLPNYSTEENKNNTKTTNRFEHGFPIYELSVICNLWRASIISLFGFKKKSVFKLFLFSFFHFLNHELYPKASFTKLIHVHVSSFTIHMKISFTIHVSLNCHINSFDNGNSSTFRYSRLMIKLVFQICVNVKTKMELVARV